jgi:AcrR family transcriptional regulator
MGRPTTPRLSRDSIVDAALRILDGEGADALSMRRLAQELDVQGASLYHHIGSKAELRDAVAERIMSEITVPRNDGWEAALVGYARQLYGILTAHPHAVAFFGMHHVTSAVGLQNYSDLTREFEACGVDALLGQQIALAVEDLTMGAAMMATVPTPTLTSEQREVFPELARKYDASAEIDVGDGFEFGLRMLIDGYRAALDLPEHAS